MCVRGVLLAVPRHVLSPFARPSHLNLFSRDIQRTRCHATSTFANKYPSSGTWTAVKLFSFHSLVNQMPHIWYHAQACGVMWLRGEAGQVCVNALECCSLSRDGECHFDTHLLKATCCQFVVKTVNGFWTALPENT